MVSVFFLCLPETFNESEPLHLKLIVLFVPNVY